MSKDQNPSQTTANAVLFLQELRRLMELGQESAFKIRAFERAAIILSGREDLEERARQGTLTELEGIGPSIASLLTEFLLTGKSSLRDELMAALPVGLLDLVKIPGLGPAKARQLIETLQIHSVTELEQACLQNRLLMVKGFGEKAQKSLLEGIAFFEQSRNKQLCFEARGTADAIVQEIRRELGTELKIVEVGALRRRLEVLSELDFLIEVPDDSDAALRLRETIEKVADDFRQRNPVLPLWLHYSDKEHFGYHLARYTGSHEFWRGLGVSQPMPAQTEEEFFFKLGLPWIAPELRETSEVINIAREGNLGKILPCDGLQGIFHLHTSFSDGEATIEELVQGAKRMGYTYVGISDHSQSAYYAGGLKPPDVLRQQREIQKVQERHPDMRVFFGIESDILEDGSLDYDETILSRFDFVIASIHSRFKMEKKQMTERILAAIRNPHTKFLGHATGRLLLGRRGYDVDMEAVIDEATRCGVAIEINANPMRLDIDWRWGPVLRKYGTLISVNPDAHSVEGLPEIEWGISTARKALLPSSQVLNSRSAGEVEQWLKR